MEPILNKMTEQEKKQTIEDLIHMQARCEVTIRYCREMITSLTVLDEKHLQAQLKETTEDKILDAVLRIEQLLIKMVVSEKIEI